MRRFLGLILFSLAAFVPAAIAADGPAVKPFNEVGVVVDVFELFPRALDDSAKATQASRKSTLKEVSARALVTKEGVYAFLETPENQSLLRELKLGSPVSVKGRLFVSGDLLHVDSIADAPTDPGIDPARYKDEKGTEVTLKGTNKCQCGLDVGDLPHSCTLGHLHHLEAEDGKTYHYLQHGDGKSAFLGTGTHFKHVQIKARVFPGQFLLVERGRLLP